MDDVNKKPRFVLYLSVILLAGVAVLLIKFDPFYLGASNDRELISSFHQHRTQFVKLQKMINQDRVTYVTEQYVDPNLTRIKWKEYKTIMEKISPGLVLTYSPQSTRYIFSRGGFLSVGPEWEKGIEYINSHKRDGILKGSLDNPGRLAYGETYLRKIQPHWFIFFQKTH